MSFLEIGQKNYVGQVQKLRTVNQEPFYKLGERVDFLENELELISKYYKNHLWLLTKNRKKSFRLF